jgi:hypothetical protein
MSPVASIAGYQASVVVSTSAASRSAASTAHPRENPTCAARQAAAKQYVAPAESERINTWGASGLSGAGR